ncbi:MAG: hypothetical protein ACE5ID_01720, partial [Acidobacteriota bacterium]
ARAAAWLPTLAGLGAVTILPLGAGASLMVAGICAATWMAAAIPRLTGRPLSVLEKTARLGAMLLALAGILGPAQARQPLLKAATQRPKLMVRQGMAQEAKNDLAAAIRWYRKALELAPRQARVQARLGELLRLEGHEAAARSAYEAALELDPTLLITRQQLALLLLDSGEPGEAARRLQAAGREALNEPAVASTLAEALSRIPSRTTEAVAAWRHYLEISRGIEGQKPRRSHARSRLRELQRKAP